MKILLETARLTISKGETITVRLMVLNDSYQPVEVDRRLLIGPNPMLEPSVSPPFPVSIEPAFTREEQNKIILNPRCFYGRERAFEGFPPGKATIYAYLLKQPSGSLPPQRPGDPKALLMSAEPLVLTILER